MRDLKQLQALPLEAKIQLSKERIRVWYESWWRFKIENLDTGKIRWETFDMRDREDPPIKENEFASEGYPGSVYVSFSGGKDSTVLKHIVDSMYDDVPSVFVNTGLEYPEIQKFAKSQKNVTVVRPEMRFDEVLRRYGYPIIGKEAAKKIYEARRNPNGYAAQSFRPDSKRAKEYGGRFSLVRYENLLHANFDISDKCCDVMKKKPSKKYEKETGRRAMLAMLACESDKRAYYWQRTGCNAFLAERPQSNPMAFWTEQDILHYIKKYDVPYCSIYGDIWIKPHSEDYLEGQIDAIDYLGCYGPEDTLETTGCKRTGCIFCMFGCHLEKEPNRFQRLKETHPRQYAYCIGGGEMIDGQWQPNKEGLGLGHVLDYIGVKY